MHLDAADARAQARGQHFHLVADMRDAAPERARDNGPRSFDGETAVHGQAHRLLLGATGGAAGGKLYGFPQLVQALPGSGGNGNDRGRRIWRAGQARAHLVLHEQRPFLVHQVAFRQRHHAGRHGQKLQHRQMLIGLRHDAVIGGDAQKRHVDAGGARDHLAHEALVARHVDHAHGASVGQLKLGKAELDGDAALLLLA